MTKRFLKRNLNMQCETIFVWFQGSMMKQIAEKEVSAML